jgi:hypothetical protein
MIEFEVGARPAKPLSIAIRDERDTPVNVVGYSSFQLEILDTNNRKVDLTGVQINEVPQAIGVFSVTLPKNRTLFPEKGRYLLRLVLNGSDGSKDITRTAEIRVREFGRLN